MTSNPAVAIGVGIAVQAATDEAVGRYMRSMHKDQQDMIAALAGAMPVGETRPWAVKHTLPIENGHGQVRVTRAFGSALALCKEFVFSVQDGDGPNAPDGLVHGERVPAGQRLEVGVRRTGGRTLGQSAIKERQGRPCRFLLEPASCV